MEFCVRLLWKKSGLESYILQKEISKYAKSQSTSKEYEYRYDRYV